MKAFATEAFFHGPASYPPRSLPLNPKTPRHWTGVEEEPKRKEEEFLQKGGKKTNTPEDNGLSTRHSHTTFILAPTDGRIFGVHPGDFRPWPA
jgi:hypothetical protein